MENNVDWLVFWKCLILMRHGGGAKLSNQKLFFAEFALFSFAVHVSYYMHLKENALVSLEKVIPDAKMNFICESCPNYLILPENSFV
jgi:hypothetical protein